MRYYTRRVCQSFRRSARHRQYGGHSYVSKTLDSRAKQSNLRRLRHAPSFSAYETLRDSSYVQCIFRSPDGLMNSLLDGECASSIPVPKVIQEELIQPSTATFDQNSGSGRSSPRNGRSVNDNGLQRLISGAFRIFDGNWWEYSVERATDAIARSANIICVRSSWRACYLCRVSGRIFYGHWTLRSKVEDLETSLDIFREAIELLPDGHRGHLHIRHRMASILRHRFAQFGLVEDITRSLQYSRGLLERYPQGWKGRAFDIWPDISRYQLLDELAQALLLRFQLLGSRSDLEEAQNFTREILELLPPGERRGHYQHQLAYLLLQSYKKSGKQAELDEACQFADEAVERNDDEMRAVLFKMGNYTYYYYLDSPGGRQHGLSALSTRCLTLGTCLLRSQSGGSENDLEESVGLLREALETAKIPFWGVVEKSHLFNVRVTLMIALATRFEKTRTLSDIELCNSILQDTIADSRGRRPSRFGPLSGTFTRMNDFFSGIRLITYFHDHHEVFKAFDPAQQSTFVEFCLEVMHLLPSVAYLGLDISARLQILRQGSNVTCYAAEHALVLSRPRTAVEILEAGRGLFWIQGLRLRTSFDTLPPSLASRLKETSALLSDSNHPPTSESPSARLYDEEAGRKRQLSHQFQCLLEEARRLPGFENFLLPLPFSRLHIAAERGPVVVLVSSRPCKALLLRSFAADLEQIELPDISLEKVQSLGFSMDGASLRARQSSRLRHMKIGAPRKKVDTGYEDLLSLLWRSVLSPIVEALGLKKAQGRRRPRIWLCLTGPFIFLPLHASGIYSKGSSHCLTDYAVPSYIPTIGTLVNAREGLNQVIRSDAKVLLVAAPTSPGQTNLPKTVNEIQRIINIIPAASLLHSPKPWESSASQVMAHLPETSIIHLACHGEQQKDNPLESGFFLQEGKLSVAQLMSISVPKAYFAFLSACQSASADRTQPDESVHMAATMMYLGFRSAIGTMWSMHDVDGPHIASAIYPALLKDGKINGDIDAIPYALDEAVRELRNEGVHPSRWATYIHMGV
ncbi:hypothetical protein JAAARDRAFT_42076 [Jaapia argillacea MUCL 33604]|uniref:CHAT domain-containing protein n=1 Tax=Jaapia argillacea MUCL 33604 TaxID=933084 RepID=A0A067P695_9AGAM|nr:hypothetical protein JAAARDRAFT_42076 [Jaapia argillacea MUCL 33604]